MESWVDDTYVAWTSEGKDAVEGALAVKSWLDDTHVNNSLWDWERGLQRERMLSSSGSACCGVMGGRHSFVYQLLMGLGGWASERKGAV